MLPCAGWAPHRRLDGREHFSCVPRTVFAQVWASGLMDCCDDGYICCVGYFMSACLYGENYRKIYVSALLSGYNCRYPCFPASHGTNYYYLRSARQDEPLRTWACACLNTSAGMVCVCVCVCRVTVAARLPFCTTVAGACNEPTNTAWLLHAHTCHSITLHQTARCGALACVSVCACVRVCVRGLRRLLWRLRCCRAGQQGVL